MQSDAARLRLGSTSIAWRDLARVFAIGAGKASARMALALEQILGERLTGGCVVVKDGYGAPTARVDILEAGHPYPDERGQRAVARILHTVSGTTERDLVVACISGGGSALTPAPPDGITLGELQIVTGLLLRSGATINQMNTVRKHLSVFHGGRLAEAVAPARLATLILSDVVGNPLDVIASGPTVPDPSTFADALAVFDSYGLRAQVPAPVRVRLEAGLAGRLPETPKPGDPRFARVTNLIVADNARAGGAAVAAAQAEGFTASFVTSYAQGEAREIARLVAGTALDIRRNGRPLPSPGVAIFGGETTVTVRGRGKGGRNQELALAAALVLEGVDGVAVFALATDGSDGPTDAAGAIVDGGTVARGRTAGLDAAQALRANDAYPFLAATGDLVRTGPTATNVNDLYFALAW